MIKSVVLPNQEFETKSELYRALKTNKDKIIGLKKAAIKHSEPIEVDQSIAIKSENFEQGYIYPIINTTNYQDSHKDIHLKGIWNKSIPEQKGKIHYLTNHKMEIGNVIAYPKDVEVMVKDMQWSSFGKSYEGTTQALIFKTNVFDYSNADAKHVVKERIPINNSVSMQYIKIEMGINSDDPEYKEEYAVYKKYKSEVANLEEFNKEGYGFFVSEAKIVREGSMVLAGSNDQTPIAYPTENKSLSDIVEFAQKVGDELTKENFDYFCSQLKALEENEAVDLTLPKQEPQKSNLKQFYLSQLKTKK